MATAFSLLPDSAYLSARPPPISPDNRYEWQVAQDGVPVPENFANVGVQKTIKPGTEGFLGQKIDEFIAASSDPTHLLDDRDGALANALGLLSQLPPKTDLSTKLATATIGVLYQTLPHPPAAFIGPDYTFREANGRGNNPYDPFIGEAGQAYARSVARKHCVDPNTLPDPGLIFDTLLKRRDPTEHPAGVSSLIFAFATIITHSLFRTNYRNENKNDTSSYLDLSPLYGVDQDAQDQVRDKISGRGLLYPDTVSEERLLFLPPAAYALLVIFCRNHNYVAQKLLKINERKKWSDPPPSDAAKRSLQDEEIFQTAKLINCNQFMGLVMDDYVAGFLGLGENNAWNIPALDIMKTRGGEVERGRGNHVSIEFNLLYRWHPVLSTKDDEWMEGALKQKFTKPLTEITVPEFLGTFAKDIQGVLKTHPKDRTFGGLKREPDGQFDDGDIAKIILDAIATPANSYGAHSTPECLRVIEIMGIQQARNWGVCTMNEFREFLGLKRLESFEEWNPNPEISSTARRLYNHIDNLELYTGLQCEELMPLSAGLRFAAGYTMTRAILGDAIALVRGDRFSTVENTPTNLTNWGFQDCKREPLNGGFGAHMPKLLSRHLPRHSLFVSPYTCFPFFTPEKMKKTLGANPKYVHIRPPTRRIAKVLETYKAIGTVFSDPDTFKVVYNLGALGNGYGFFMGFDDRARHDPDRALAIHSLFPSQSTMDEYRAWYKDQTHKRLQENSWGFPGLPGKYIDIVNDVINTTSMHWAADNLCGIPLKTKENPKGLLTVIELYEMLTTVFDLTILGLYDNEHGFELREKTTRARDILEELVYESFYRVAPETIPAGKTPWVKNTFPGPFPSDEFMKRLVESKKPVNELCAMVVSFSIGQSVNYAQATSHVVDFYFDEARNKERAEILRLVQLGDANSFELLCGYVREGMRLNPQFTGLWRQYLLPTPITVDQGPGFPPVRLEQGDRIWGSFGNAHRNPYDFPNPLVVDPTRPSSSYNLLGSGFHNCLGVDYAVKTISEMLSVIFKLPGLRRAPGGAGILSKFTEIADRTETVRYITPDGKISNWPGKLILMWDAPAEKPLDQKAIDDLIDLGKKEGDTDTKDKLDAIRKVNDTLKAGGKVDEDKKKEIDKAALDLLLGNLPKITPTPLGTKTNESDTPYTRLVNKPLTVLPTSAEVFEKIIKGAAPGTANHPAGLSGLFFSFGSIISLSKSYPSTSDPKQNKASNALDLLSLYGFTEVDSREIRPYPDSAEGGRGLLLPDALFESDARLAYLAPSAVALLILFNRNHNFIAAKLLQLNEQKKWADPATLKGNKAALTKQDDEIFLLAQRLNRVAFRNIVVNDFLKGLLGFDVYEDVPIIDLFSNIQPAEVKRQPASVEFALHFGWNSMLASGDITKLKDALELNLGSTDVTPADVAALYEGLDDPDKSQRSCGGLERSESTNAFHDSDVAGLLIDAIGAPAAVLDSKATAETLKVFELEVLDRARAWGVCGLNDFRQVLRLPAYKTFEEWAGANAAAAAAAKALYGTIDKLELYVGLRGEQPSDIRGFKLGNTLTQGLIADVIQTVRSDANLQGASPDTLTKWGYDDFFGKPPAGSAGGSLASLLTRNLPLDFPAQNVYSLFSLYTPTTVQQLVTQARAKNPREPVVTAKYTFDKPVPSA